MLTAKPAHRHPVGSRPPSQPIGPPDPIPVFFPLPRVRSSARGANANSTLLAGAEEGSLEKVQKALEAGADPNVKDNNGLDPLTWAAKKGHAEIAKLLLQKGASAEEEDKENLLPLHHAAIKGKDKCLAAMLEVGVKVKVTVKSGDKAGYTALHFAAEKGHTSACTVLLKHGADVNAPEKRQKYTPLHLAAGKGRDKVVELLLESGAEIQVRVASSRGGVAFASLTLCHVCAVPGHGRGRKHCTAQGGRCRHGEGGGTLDRQACQRDCHEQGAWVGGGRDDRPH